APPTMPCAFAVTGIARIPTITTAMHVAFICALQRVEKEPTRNPTLFAKDDIDLDQQGHATARTFGPPAGCLLYPPKAGICSAPAHIRSRPLADITNLFMSLLLSRRISIAKRRRRNTLPSRISLGLARSPLRFAGSHAHAPYKEVDHLSAGQLLR